MFVNPVGYAAFIFVCKYRDESYVSIFPLETQPESIVCTSISSVFQSYQEDGWMIVKGCVQWNPIYG